MTFEEKCAAHYYNCTLPYGKPGTEERTVYRTKQNELHVEFNADLEAYLVSLGVPEQYKKKAGEYCYDHGHSGGYQEVMCYAQGVADIFR